MTEQISLVPKRRFKEFQSSHPWKTINLKEIVNLLKDGTHGTHQDGNYAFLLSAKNIKNGQIIIDEVNDRKILSEDYNLIFKNYKLIDQDLLVTIVGTIGQTALYKESTLRVAFQRSVAIIRGDKHVNQNFLKYTIDSSYTQKQLKQSASMSAQAGVYLGDLEKLKLYIPEFTEQIKIGLFLRQLDDLITIQQRKLDKTKALKDGYLSEMFPSEGELVPKRRFAGFTQDWELKKLGELTGNFEYGLNASAISFDGINKYIRITDIDDQTRVFNQIALTSPDANLSKAENYILKKGDILFARTGASVGKTYRYRESDGKVYYAGFLIRASIDSQFDTEFVFQNTLTKQYNNFVRITSQRSGQPGINAQEYSQFNLMVPELDEQRKIGNFFKQLDQLIQSHQKKLDKLQNLKKAYLHEMFV